MAHRDVDHLVLARPCPTQIPAMTGERSGWCEQCGKTVHNLSAGSRKEAESLLARSEDLCVAFRRRPDGGMVFNLAVMAGAALLASCLPLRGGKPPVQDLASDPPGQMAPAGSGVEEFHTDASLPLGTVRVRVVDDTELEIPATRVSLYLHSGDACALRGKAPVATGNTNGDGRVELTGLAPGDYHVVGEHAGFLNGRASLRLGGEGVAGTLTLRVDAEDVITVGGI